MSTSPAGTCWPADCLRGDSVGFQATIGISTMKQGRQAAPDLGSNATQPLPLHVVLRFTNAFLGVASMQRCAFQLKSLAAHHLCHQLDRSPVRFQELE